MNNRDVATQPRNPIRLSAIIPNYNHGAVIGEAIHSIATQSRPPDEIVIVDDGSTDDSAAIIDKLRSTYPTLRLVRLEKNSGAINALNRGIAEARGEFIYFGAADDLVLPGLYASVLEVLEAHPSAAFSCAESIVCDVDTGRRSPRPPVRPSYVAAYLSPDDVAAAMRRADNWIISSAAIARRSLVIEAGGLDPALASFADGFLYRHLAFKHGCCFVPQVGAEWRVSSKGYSRREAANIASSLKTLAIAQDRMRGIASFPSWYPEVFGRRWLFDLGRIAATTHPMNSTVLNFVARGTIGKTILAGAVRQGGAIGRFVALSWLALQQRPMSYAGLARTWLSRHFSRLTAPGERPA